LKKRATNKGQVLIELFVTLAGALLLLELVSPQIYFVWAKFWLRHVVYESLICEMKAIPRGVCEREFKKKVKQFLPIGELESFTLTHFPFRMRADTRFVINRDLWIRESITLHRNGSNEGGFIQLLFLLPLAISIFTGFILIGSIMTERSRNMQMCRGQLMEASAEIERGISQIIALNRPIGFLHTERKALELAKLAAITPQARAAVEIMIRRNEIAQISIVTRQKALRVAALVKSRAKLMSLPQSEQLRYSTPRLILQPEATTQTAKQMTRPPQFSRLHRIEASWKVSLERLNAALKFPSHFIQTLKIKCATTIRQEGHQWIAQLSI